MCRGKSRRPRVSSIRSDGRPSLPRAAGSRRSAARRRAISSTSSTGRTIAIVSIASTSDRQHLAARIVTRPRGIPEGVALTYTIEAGPETHVRFSGMTLARQCRWRKSRPRGQQSVFEGFLIEEAEEIVRRELALQATYQPSVEVRVEGDDSVRTLVIDVTPGPRARANRRAIRRG